MSTFFFEGVGGKGAKKLEIFPCFPKHCLLGAYLELQKHCFQMLSIVGESGEGGFKVT